MARDKLKLLDLARQKNPQVIRQLIDWMIREDFEDSTLLAARKLQEKVQLSPRRRLHPHLGRHSLDRLLADQTEMSYSHLATFARYYDLPTGLLLIYSRMLSELTDTVDGKEGSADRALRTLDAVRAALETLRDKLVEARGTNLGLVGFRAMQKAYLHALDGTDAPDAVE